MKNKITTLINVIKSSTKAKIVTLISCIAITCFTLLLFLPFMPGSWFHKDVESTFVIQSGTSYSQVIDDLAEEGLISNEREMYYVGKIAGLDDVQAGTFYLSNTDSPMTILKQVNGILPTGDLSIVITEGSNIAMIGDAYAAATGNDAQEAITVWDSTEYVQSMCDKFPDMLDCDVVLNPEIIHPLEGYFAPATYNIDESTTPEQFGEMMLTSMNNTLVAYYPEMEEMGLTVHETLTLASIIQKETNEAGSTIEQRQNISSVFWNRTEIYMALQSDTTVNYFLNDYKVNLSEEEMYTESAYSTYTNVGLPVGPISSPESYTIEAALNPADTDYYYFYASPEGEVFFTETYDEHLQIKAEHPWPEGS